MRVIIDKDYLIDELLYTKCICAFDCDNNRMNEISEIIDNYNRLYAQRRRERYHIRVIKTKPEEVINYLINEINEFTELV